MEYSISNNNSISNYNYSSEFIKQVLSSILPSQTVEKIMINFPNKKKDGGINLS